MSDAPVNQVQPFNPREHLMQIKNRGGASDYLPVAWRLVWFREVCPDGQIETELVTLDLDRETEEEGYQWNEQSRRSERVTKRANGLAVFKATVRDGKGGIATGYKSEKAASFPDFVEKAETGSIGRALAALGYGTQFAPDLDEQHRIVDAPADRSTPTPRTTARPEQDASSTLATEQQLASIRKLSQHLGKPEPEDMDKMTYPDAKTTITALSREYNESKQQRAFSTANAAKREIAQLPMTEKQLAELKSAFAVAFLVDGPEVNQRFARWVGAKLQGAVPVEKLTAAHYKPLMDLIDQEGKIAS